MNISKLVRKTNSKIERIHSEYLTEALQASYKGDGELFTEFWNLAVDSDEKWPVPVDATIEAETQTSKDGLQRTSDAPEALQNLNHRQRVTGAILLQL
jgi:hypothetical protein